MEIKIFDVTVGDRYCRNVLELLDPEVGGHGGGPENRMWISAYSGKVLDHTKEHVINKVHKTHYDEPYNKFEMIRQWINDDYSTRVKKRFRK